MSSYIHNLHFKRASRALKPDIDKVKGIPAEVRKNLSLWASCIGGAIELEAYTDAIRKVGFTKIEVANNTDYPLETIKDWITPMEEDADKKQKN